MTRDVREIFVIQLARATDCGANKFLKSKGLSRDDCDDVIASAMAWCWEHRAQYSLTTSLETWFMNAIRDAHKAFRRKELPMADESMQNLNGSDDTYQRAASESSTRALMAALTPVDRKIARMLEKGYTYFEISQVGEYSNQTISSARRRIKQLRKLLPDLPLFQSALHATAPASSEDDEAAMPRIDKELERLDFPPPAGKDCPPCWRCKWYDGLMPDGKRSTRMDISDVEVREAVANTEARKIEIAQQVRNEE